MVNTLFDTVWRDISPFAVGFDRTFDALSIMANSKSQSINYPPQHTNTSQRFTEGLWTTSVRLDQEIPDAHESLLHLPESLQYSSKIIFFRMYVGPSMEQGSSRKMEKDRVSGREQEADIFSSWFWPMSCFSY